MEPCFPQNKLKPGNYDNITTLLMIIPRLLNDLQSYQVIQLLVLFAFRGLVDQNQSKGC